MYEEKAIAVALLRKFRFAIDSKHLPIKETHGIIMKPAQGMPLIITLRKWNTEKRLYFPPFKVFRWHNKNYTLLLHYIVELVKRRPALQFLITIKTLWTRGVVAQRSSNTKRIRRDRVHTFQFKFSVIILKELKYFIVCAWSACSYFPAAFSFRRIWTPVNVSAVCWTIFWGRFA